MKEFREYLQNQTKLLPSSIGLYVRTVSRYLAEYGEPTVETMNRFISDSMRNKRSLYVKFALRYYLKHKKCFKLYKGLVQPRSFLPEKHVRTILPKERLLEIITQVSDERYRTVALIQYVSGARASDVLRTHTNNIIRKEKGAVLALVTKGGKKRHIFIPEKYFIRIKSFLDKQDDYPFIKGKKEDIERAIHNNYTYYYLALRNAASKCGHKFSTHDFRFNFATDYYSYTKNILAVQREMGHKSIKDTMRYIRDVGADSEKVIEAIR